MTATTPVERVSDILQAVSYRRLPTPLAIAGLKFDVAAAYLGSGRSSDLVLVADTAFETADRILRMVEGIGRALDVMRSKRPVTLVLAGPRPRADIIEAMAKVCRVLPIGTPVDHDPVLALINWLAILLPLNLPDSWQEVADPLATIRTRASAVDERIRELIEIAPEGADAVQSALHQVLTRALDQAEEI